MLPLNTVLSYKPLCPGLQWSESIKILTGLGSSYKQEWSSEKLQMVPIFVKRRKQEAQPAAVLGNVLSSMDRKKTPGRNRNSSSAFLNGEHRAAPECPPSSRLPDSSIRHTGVSDACAHTADDFTKPYSMQLVRASLLSLYMSRPQILWCHFYWKLLR